MLHLLINTTQFSNESGNFNTLMDIEDFVRIKGDFHKDDKLRIAHNGKFLLPDSSNVKDYFIEGESILIVDLGDNV